MKAHVVRHEDVVEARRTHALEQRAPPLEGPREHRVVGERPQFGHQAVQDARSKTRLT